MTEEQLIAYCRKNNNARMPAYSGLCQFCGGVFWSGHFKPNALYCSRQCCGKDRSGSRANGWKGGVWKTSKGYVHIKSEAPNANGWGGILEHRAVMQKMLGRELAKHETVHHKNGIKDDNRPENLELWSSRPQPYGQRARDIVDFVADNYEKDIRVKLEIKDLVRGVLARLASHKTLADIPNSEVEALLINRGGESGL